MKNVRLIGSFVFVLFFIQRIDAATTERLFQQRFYPEWTDDLPTNEWFEESQLVEENTLVRLTIGLKIRNADKLEEKFWSVSDPDNPDYGNYMSLDELASMISPLPSDISVVRAWLLSHGVTELRSVVTNDFVTVVAPVRVVQEMFQVTLRHFKHHSRKSDSLLIRSPVPYSIPVELSSIIDIVFGLTNFPGQRPVIEWAKRSASQFAPPVYPQVIKKVLHIGNVTGSGRADNVQATVQFDNEYYAQSDLTYFLNYFGMPDQNISKVIGYNDPSSPGTEATLDVEYIIGVGSNVSTWFYSNDQSSGFLDWILLMNNETVQPNVVSISYGEIEDGLSLRHVTKINTEFVKAGVRGVTLLFASGDSGAGCNSNGTAFQPNWPATSPYVTAVGGIILDQVKPFAVEGDPISGGGFSSLFNAPKYQTQAIANYKASTGLPPLSYFNPAGRGVPDLSAFSENVIVFMSGGEVPAEGTSCAAPITAGVLSLINDALLANGRPPLGFFNQLLYKLVPASPKSVYDVTTGRNPDGNCPGFSCAKAWDPVTGWGVVMFDELRDAIFKYLKIE